MADYKANPITINNTTQTGESGVYQGTRPSSEFLPSINRTSLNVKMLENTLDQVLSSGTLDTVDSYWGQKTAKILTEKQFYREGARIRDLNQLTVAIRNAQGMVAYQDVLATHGFENDNLKVNSKFAVPGYVLDLPINLDMFVNFLDYYWMPDYLPICEIEGTVAEPVYIPDIVKLNTWTSPSDNNAGIKSVTLTNGMRVRFVGDNVTGDSDYKKDAVYFVERVGSGQIRLILQYENTTDRLARSSAQTYTPRVDEPEGYWDYRYAKNLLPDYVVQDRSSQDQNSWARSNHWVDVKAIRRVADYLDVTESSLLADENIVQAKHPIIEFKPDLELYNSGTVYLRGVDLIIEDIDVDAELIGEASYPNVTRSSRILFLNAGSYSNGIYQVDGISDGDPQNNSITLIPEYEEADLIADNTIHIMNPNSKHFGRNMHWTGSEWVLSQEKKARSAFPRFELYNDTGINLADPSVYPDSDFGGNTIWQYKTGTGEPDSELGFAPVSSSRSDNDYEFEFTIETVRYEYTNINNRREEIPGFYYYKNFKEGTLHNGWTALATGQSARAVQSKEILESEDLEFTLYGYQPEMQRLHFTRGNLGVEVYALTHSGWVEQGRNHPTLDLERDFEYQLDLAIPETFEFTDPYGNTDVNIEVTDTKFKVTAGYEYGTVWYRDINNYANEYGIIILHDHVENNIEVFKNNSKLIDQTDYEFNRSTKKLSITKTVLANDIIQVTYPSDLSDSRENVYQAPVHVYNPLNKPFEGGAIAEIVKHIRQQIESRPGNEGNAFGENTYVESSRSHAHGGTIRQQIFSPSRTELLLEQTAGIETLLENTKRDYEQFWRKFASKVKQLWVSDHWTTVRELVDTALTDIFVGRSVTSKYALSDMAFPTSTVQNEEMPSGSDAEFIVQGQSIKLGGILNHTYVWVEDYTDGTLLWRQLIRDIDYTIVGDLLTVYETAIDFNGNSLVNIAISRIDVDTYSYIPFSMAKVGIFEPVQPSVASTYIQCHDGSRFSIEAGTDVFDLGADTFDPVAAAVFELESRIYNGSVSTEKSVRELIPRINRSSAEKWKLFVDKITSQYLRWRQYNGKSLDIYFEFDADDEFSYNYEWYLPGATSWKTLYLYMFGTSRPDLEPWKMLGYENKPAGWFAQYDWIDPPRRENLINALTAGSNAGFDKFNPDFASPAAVIDWENNSPVDANGDLLDPITAGITPVATLATASSKPTDITLLGFEEEWERSRSYAFDTAISAYAVNPYRFVEIFWKKNEYLPVKNNLAYIQWKDASTLTRQDVGYDSAEWYGSYYDEGVVTAIRLSNNTSPYYGDQTVRLGNSSSSAVIGITVNDTDDMIANVYIIEAGAEYFEDFDYELDNGTILSVEVDSSARRRTLGLSAIILEQTSLESDIFTSSETAMSLALGGFSSNNLLKVSVNSGFRVGKTVLPDKDYGVYMHRSRPQEYFRYSAIQIEYKNGYFEVSGFDFNNPVFAWFKPIENTNFDLIVTENSQIRRYNTVSKNVSHASYGTTFRKRQDLVNFVVGVFQKYNIESGLSINDLNKQIEMLFRWAQTASAGDTYMFTGGDIVLDAPEFGYIFDINKTTVIDANNTVVYNNAFDVDRNRQQLRIDFNDITPGLVIFKTYFLEHKVLVTDPDIDDYIVYRPDLGLIQARMLINGKKTRQWTGKIETPGYLVRDGAITPTFETATREIERDINVTDGKLVNPTRQKASMFNVGYRDYDFVSSPDLTEESKFELHRGMTKHTGTTESIRSFLRQNNLFGNQTLVDDEFVELWMIHLGEYGEYEKFDLLEVEIPLDLVNSSPQLIRFNAQDRGDLKNDLVIDMYKKDALVVNGDFENPLPMLPVLSTDVQTIKELQNQEKLMPTAGLPLINEADYKIGSVDDFETLYDPDAAYADLIIWDSKTSYKKDDIVRKGSRVYRLDVPSTGFSTSILPINIRGTATYPVVPSGNTLIIDGTTVDLTKTITEITYDPIEVTGTVQSPDVFNLETLVLNSITIEFSKTVDVEQYSDITVDGTVDNPIIEGTAGTTLDIDSVIIDFEETESVTVDITVNDLFEDMFSSLTDTSASKQSFVTDLNALRQAYISANGSAAWDTWIDGYFAQGIPENEDIGFNIDYLQAEYTAASGQPYETDILNFISENVDVINQITGNSYTATDPIAQVDIEAVHTELTSGTYGYLLTDGSYAAYVKSGTEIDLADSLGTETETQPREFSLSEIVTKINDAGITDVTASAVSTRLRVTKAASTSPVELVIGAATANSDVGFPATETTYTAESEIVSQGDYLTPTETVEQITNAGITGVSAYLNTNDQVVIRCTRPSLTFGGGTAAPVIGVPSSGTVEASFTESTPTVDLTLADVVDAVNDESISNVSAANIDGNLVITSTNPQLTVGEGTANSILGLTDQTILASEVINNTFDSNDWTEITEPGLFRTWLIDNKGSLNSITSSGGWNVYENQEFYLEINEVCAGIANDDEALIKTSNAHNLSVGDFVLLVGTQSEPNVDGFHRVTRVAGDPATQFYIDRYIEEKAFTGKVIPVRPVRFSTVTEMNNTLSSPKYNWRDGSIAYVDDDGNNVAAAYKYVVTGTDAPNYFEKIRTRGQRVDNRNLYDFVLYNGDQSQLLREFEVYDPAKGLIPGLAESEINLASPQDPATYNSTTDDIVSTNSKSNWNRAQQNSVWWDTSTAVYVDYEQSTVEYRRANWGRLFPTSSVDIYEWTASPVPPDEYEAAVEEGTVFDGVELTGQARSRQVGEEEFAYSWSEETRYNISIGRNETVYYFWVKDKSTVPDNRDRKLSVQVIAQIIQDPGSVGFDWAAGVSENAVMVNNLGRYLSRTGTVLQIKPRSDAELHREYILAGNYAEQKITPWMHQRVRDALTRYNSAVNEYEFSVWNSSSVYDVGAVVQYGEDFYQCVFGNQNEEPDTSSSWTLLPDATIIDDRYESSTNTIVVPSPKSIPNERQHRFNRYGNEITLRHTWAQDFETVRRTFIEQVNRDMLRVNVVDTIPNWKKLVEDFDYNNLWGFVDYSRDGESWDTREVTLQNENQLEDLDSSITYAGVINFESDYADGLRRTVFKRNGPRWQVAYKERGTLQFSSVFWDYTRRGFGWDTGPYDTIVWDADPGENLGMLFDRLRDYFYSETMRERYVNLWFVTAEATLPAHQDAYWMIKSSMVRLKTTSRPFDSGYYQKSLDANVVDYVNYEKPFHTKLESFLLETQIVDNLSDPDSINSDGDEGANFTAEDSVDYEITAYYDRFGIDGWQETTLTGNGFTSTTEEIDYSLFTSSEYDYVYDGGDFVQPVNSGWQEEYISLRIRENVEIAVQTDDDAGSDPALTRTYEVITDFYKKNRAYIVEDLGVTLAASTNRTQGNIEVNDGSLLLDPTTIPGVDYCEVKIGSEIIRYTGITGNLLLGCTRSELAVPHSAGTVVRNITTVELSMPEYTFTYSLNEPLFSELGVSIIDPINTAPGAIEIQAAEKGTIQ